MKCEQLLKMRKFSLFPTLGADCSRGSTENPRESEIGLSPAPFAPLRNVVSLNPHDIESDQTSTHSMKKIIVVSIVLLSAASVAQDAKPVTIPLGTQITARLASQLDSGQVRAGDAVTMDVLEDVKIQNAIVIPKGAIVMGRVNEATGARKMGRGG